MGTLEWKEIAYDVHCSTLCTILYTSRIYLAIYSFNYLVTENQKMTS